MPNPTEKLEVSGNIKASGFIKVGYQPVCHEHAVAPFTTEITGCDCPAGTKALGGGWFDSFGLIVSASYPSQDGNVWHIKVTNANANTLNILIYAVCARLAN